MKGRTRLAFGVLPNRPTGRKYAIKRTKLDLNHRESENEAVSNSLERKRWQHCHLGREEKSTNQIPGRKKERIAEHMCNRMFMVSKPKYLSRCSIHFVNEVVKRLNDEQREVVVRMGFGSMLELRTCSLPYDIFSWMTNQYNSKRGEDKMIYIIPLKTRLRNLSTADMEFQAFYMERFSPVGEKVSPYRNRRTPRIINWPQATINQRVWKLRELGLFSGVDVDMVDAVELEALRKVDLSPLCLPSQLNSNNRQNRLETFRV
ncbi:hypothetical protein M9H77_17985 [Catharanthus roseus]|uniref:Uncharacterized protein n=1 Tax=Catharanthus roseus TaxID=4058 RepID=A0ACC0B651_CATRO|nr:hypothetical protein M9H77_17985 [Catharanthus roseus]